MQEKCYQFSLLVSQRWEKRDRPLLQKFRNETLVLAGIPEEKRLEALVDIRFMRWESLEAVTKVFPDSIQLHKLLQVAHFMGVSCRNRTEDQVLGE
jgi:hypothetical protein